MFTHIIIFVCCAWVVTGEKKSLPGNVKDLAERLRNECSNDFHVPHDMIEDCIAGNFPEDHKDLKCFLHCLYAKGGYWKDNTADHDGILLEFPEDLRPMYEKMFINCGHITGDDPCEVAFQLHKCYHSVEPDLYSLV